MAHRHATEGKWRGKRRMEWGVSNVEQSLSSSSTYAASWCPTRLLPTADCRSPPAERHGLVHQLKIENWFLRVCHSL